MCPSGVRTRDARVGWCDPSSRTGGAAMPTSSAHTGATFQPLVGEGSRHSRVLRARRAIATMALASAMAGPATLAANAGAAPVTLVQQGEKLTVGEESEQAAGRLECGGVGRWQHGAGRRTGRRRGSLEPPGSSPARALPGAQQGPKLTAAGESAKGGFGVSVALSGDGNTAFIGAPGDKFRGSQARLGTSLHPHRSELGGNPEARSRTERRR